MQIQRVKIRYKQGAETDNEEQSNQTSLQIEKKTEIYEDKQHARTKTRLKIEEDHLDWDQLTGGEKLGRPLFSRGGSNPDEEVGIRSRDDGSRCRRSPPAKFFDGERDRECETRERFKKGG